MAGFHLPGDPYYPNQGNGSWIEEDPEEDPEEIEEEVEEEPEGVIEEEFEVEVGEEFEVDEEIVEVSSGTDSEPEVYDPPIPHSPVIRPDQPGPIPIWGSHLYYWSHQQGVRPPFGLCLDFYNVSGGVSADRALPVIVNAIANQNYQADQQAARVREINAATQGNTADIRRLEGLHENT